MRNDVLMYPSLSLACFFQGHTVLSYTISSLLACEVERVIVVSCDPARVGPLPLGWPQYPRDASPAIAGGQGPVSAGQPSTQHQPEVAVAEGAGAGSGLPSGRVCLVPGSSSRHRSIKCGLDAIADMGE